MRWPPTWNRWPPSSGPTAAGASTSRRPRRGPNASGAATPRSGRSPSSGPTASRADDLSARGLSRIAEGRIAPLEVGGDGLDLVGGAHERSDHLAFVGVLLGQRHPTRLL